MHDAKGWRFQTNKSMNLRTQHVSVLLFVRIIYECLDMSARSWVVP